MSVEKKLFGWLSEGTSDDDEATSEEERVTEEKLENSLQKRLALGILTKSDATPEIHRLARYALQTRAGELLPKERVKKCLRNRISKCEPVQVMYNPKREKAHYSNLQRCAWVWGCPVCAQVISEKRKVEVKTAIDKHLATGGGVYLCTLTIPHYQGDNLKSMLDALSVATKRLFNGTRRSKAVWGALGKVGHIKALEVTYGANGWHPHFHIIIFTEKVLPVGTSLTELVECWRNACKLAGLNIPSHLHGLDWRNAEYASQYVNKWGIEHEVTKSHLKQGRFESKTPWDMLKDSMLDIPEIAERNGKLFCEFALSFKGRKQLVWSRGLKSKYGIDEKTDDELAEETENISQEAINLEEMIWSLIKRYNCRADLLHCVEHDKKHGTETAKKLIMTLAGFEVDKILEKGCERGGGCVDLPTANTPPRSSYYDENVPDLDKPDWVLD